MTANQMPMSGLIDPNKHFSDDSPISKKKAADILARFVEVGALEPMWGDSYRVLNWNRDYRAPAQEITDWEVCRGVYEGIDWTA